MSSFSCGAASLLLWISLESVLMTVCALKCDTQFKLINEVQFLKMVFLDWHVSAEFMSFRILVQPWNRLFDHRREDLSLGGRQELGCCCKSKACHLVYSTLRTLGSNRQRVWTPYQFDPNAAYRCYLLFEGALSDVGLKRAWEPTGNCRYSLCLAWNDLTPPPPTPNSCIKLIFSLCCNSN